MLAVIDLFSQSPYLFAGGVLILIAIAISVLKGLLDIAKYLAILAGIILLLIGGANFALNAGILFI